MRRHTTKTAGTECLIHHHTYKPKHRHDHHAEYAMVYSDAIEDKIDLTIEELKKKYPDLTNYRWHAIKLLEQDKEITKRYPVNLPDVIDRNYESDIINEKYDFIQEIIKEVLVNKDRQDALTEKADRALTHRFWSIPIFLGIMALVFFLTFTIGDWLKGYLEVGIESLSDVVNKGLIAAGVSEMLRSLFGRWYHSWCGRYPYLFAEYFYPFSGTGLSGGQRIYGPCCVCHGRDYE